VAIAGDPNSHEAERAVERLRNDYVPEAFDGVTGARALVGGFTAENLDGFEMLELYTPIVFAFVLGLSFLLLLFVFRSIVVPIMAVIMNLLSVGAAYGLLVLVTQHGFLTGVLGFQQVESIEAWLPIFLFAILFGLSMDYHVFLLSRIRERYDETHDNEDAVVFGVRSTGRLITGAALIMVAVFAGFAAGDLVMFQQMGFGAGVAVLIDATIVRSILVPASMKLLGDWNWYLPSWLEWLPDVRVEGGSPPSPRAAAVPGGASEVAGGGGN
jgi:RND superfamily putative drug exporter